MGIIVETYVSCDCTDWERHQAHDQGERDLIARSKRVADVEVVDVRKKGQLLIVRTRTKDRRGDRFHEVIMSAPVAGRKVGWRCKHILAAETVVGSSKAA